MMNNDIHFGTRIKSLADEYGVDKAADKIGYSREALYPIFRKKDVSTKLLKKIADAFRMDISYFFQQDVISQTGRINNIGDSKIKYSNTSSPDSSLLFEVESLRSLLASKDSEIKTLREMIDLLKSMKRE